MSDKAQQLYRHFDSNNVLLYVGVSVSAVHRLTQHKRTAHWFNDLSRVDIEQFSSRKAVLAAEKKAVVNEKPKYNKQLKTARVTASKISAWKLTDRIVFKPVYHIGEVAGMLDISTTIFYRRYVKSGKLHPFKMKKKVREYDMLTGWQVIEFLESLQGEVVA